MAEELTDGKWNRILMGFWIFENDKPLKAVQLGGFQKSGPIQWVKIFNLNL